LVNTWMKWNIFGAESKQPVYIFVVGELAPESGQILCTAVNGYSFYVSQRFVDRLIACTDEEQARLASKISQAVVLDNNEQPKLLDGGKGLSPSVAYSYAENFTKKEVPRF
jgi:hypothetical protein